MLTRKMLAQSPKIVCIGRNYIDHAKELGNAVPTEPFFFLKPASSLLLQGAIERPIECKDLHYEVELGLLIGTGGRDIPESKALDHIGAISLTVCRILLLVFLIRLHQAAGYVLALDMTARDIQEAAKAKKLPWTIAKGYDTFCPISKVVPKRKLADPQSVDLWLKVDGQLKQQGNTRDMIFSIAKQISFLSHRMTLCPGDLILTGTPAGVGPVLPGQTITAGLDAGGKSLGTSLLCLFFLSVRVNQLNVFFFFFCVTATLNVPVIARAAPSAKL
jgi:acylpyruvate hydrolase